MFQATRIKLTFWYLLIIMLISLLFSLVIYSSINRELERFKYMQARRLEREQGRLFIPSAAFRRDPLLDLESIKAAQERLSIVLVLINMGILGISGIAAYFLAGKTLKPIKDMLDEQNRFITDASHELRTPLTALRSEIEVNLRDKHLSLRNAKSLLLSNLEEVINLQSLSDDLMQLTQYQKKNDHFILEDVSVRELINSACKQVAPLASEKHISLKNGVKHNRLRGNKSSLIELFVILLDNAIKYSNDNTVIKIHSQTNNNQIEIRVQDQGIGIGKTDLSYIFERFYRVDKSRSKEKITGYGLGLSIAKKIVNLHKGSIEAESVLGKGSNFKVTLPLY